jgi:methyl-accepting chemotaxis protein
MSIRNQILFPVILMAVLLVGSALGVSIWQFSGYVNNSVMDETNRSLKGLSEEIESRKQEALSKSTMAANYPGLAAAVAANDTNAVLALMTPVAKEAKVDFLTVLSANGTVVARVHDPAKRGDSLAN